MNVVSPMVTLRSRLAPAQMDAMNELADVLAASLQPQES